MDGEDENNGEQCCKKKKIKVSMREMHSIHPEHG